VTGIVTNLKFGNRNAGFMETEGYDLDVSYRLDTRFGKFNARLATTYVSKRPTAPPTTARSSRSSPTASAALSASVPTWCWAGSGATSAQLDRALLLRREGTCSNIALYPDECSDPGVYAPWYKGARNYNERGAVTFHDVQVRYSLPWDATVSVGANNVFEKTGPVMYSKPNSAFSYYGGFDIGRFIYMKYQQRF
jgi:iron complex outermembrane receptor protein